MGSITGSQSINWDNEFSELLLVITHTPSTLSTTLVVPSNILPQSTTEKILSFVCRANGGQFFNGQIGLNELGAFIEQAYWMDSDTKSNVEVDFYYR